MKLWTHLQTKHSLLNKIYKLKQQNWHVSWSWHARNFATNHTICFFVSEWLIPLKYPLHNHFSLYCCLILNSKKEVDISHVSSKSLIVVYRYERQNLDAGKGRSTFLYIDVFYNTFMFLHFNTNQNLFWFKKVNFGLCKQCRKSSKKFHSPNNCQHIVWSYFTR